ncbi:NACHT domain-containing protein [Pseudomonas brassicacearum]|uniref:NACHT domain-containing protein n=1 Tax=Pseudomonas brassicacearum TaxID=930166 RepID=UPI000AFAC30B|nr:NACHT domain-containing protein [Pseudomonas brassicacearum]
MTDFISSVPDLWSETNLRPYLGEVKRRHGVVETLALPSMRDLPPVQIETLFVPPLLAQVTVSADSDPDSWPAGRTLLTELQDFKQLVVLGDPGGGKTTLSNWLAWRLAAGLNSPLPEMLQNRVPIPCVLRDMPVELFSLDVTLIDLVDSVADKLLGNRATTSVKQALSKRVSLGAYVLILDGIDEIPIAHRQVVAGWIRSASEQGGCVLATSRVIGYEDYPVDGFDGAVSHIVGKKFTDKKFDVKNLAVSNYFEVSQKVHSNLRSGEYVESREPRKWAHIRYLMPFDQGRIAAFAENWYRQRCMTQQEATQKTTDLLAALSQSEVTQKLARTPNLLSLMAIVHRERAHLPDGKALLYEEIVNAYINTIDKQRKIAPGDILAQYGWKERKAWLAYVGFKMQATRGISGNRDTGILAEESDVEQWLSDAMTISGVPSPQQAAKTFLNWVARRSGLLLPRGEARYAFVHLSFQEYFCACYLDSCIVRPAFIKDKLPKDADVTKVKLADWSSDSHWLETLIFLFELLSAERDSEWVDDLVRIIFGENVDAFAPYDRSSEVASRIITNKHIKISLDLRDGLAVSLGPNAISEWEGERYNPNSGVLSALLDAGYAAVIGDSIAENIYNDKSLLGKCYQGLEDVECPERVCILIVETDQSISADMLKEFVNVKYLRMKGTGLSESSFLTQFNGLKLLQLMSVPITDIDPVARFSELSHVEIHDMAISDIGPLSSLRYIHTLELHGLDILDLSPLAKLKGLIYLSLKKLKVNDFKPLAVLKGLKTLYLDDIPDSDLAPVAGLKKLQYLKIADSPIQDWNFLLGLKKLTSLDLRGIPINDLSTVGAMKGLQTLYLTRCDVSSFEPLKKLSGLRGIAIMHIPINNIEFISAIKGLSTCYLSGGGVTDLSPLSSLKKLSFLSIDDVSIPDLTPIAECKELRFLDIDCQSSIDVLPLRALSNLRSLHLRSASVENLTSLDGVEGLKVKWESVE